MIDPSQISVSTLPSVSLIRKADLPTEPCIYFAIDGDDHIQYIGRSKNPAQRWASHHRYSDLCPMSGVRIAYMYLDEDLLPSVEKALIDWFKPPLNKKPGGVRGTPLPTTFADTLFGRLAQAIAALGLTIPQGAQRIAGCAPCENRAKYRAALKRLRRCTSNKLPESLALFEADLKALGLEIVIKPEEL